MNNSHLLIVASIPLAITMTVAVCADMEAERRLQWLMAARIFAAVYWLVALYCLVSVFFN